MKTTGHVCSLQLNKETTKSESSFVLQVPSSGNTDCNYAEAFIECNEELQLSVSPFASLAFQRITVLWEPFGFPLLPKNYSSQGALWLPSPSKELRPTYMRKCIVSIILLQHDFAFYIRMAKNYSSQGALWLPSPSKELRPMYMRKCIVSIILLQHDFTFYIRMAKNYSSQGALWLPSPSKELRPMYMRKCIVSIILLQHDFTFYIRMAKNHSSQGALWLPSPSKELQFSGILY